MHLVEINISNNKHFNFNKYSFCTNKFTTEPEEISNNLILGFLRISHCQLRTNTTFNEFLANIFALIRN